MSEENTNENDNENENASEPHNNERRNEEGEGALFVNNKWEREGHPHYTGTICHDGRDYWVSAWIKEAGAKAKNPGSTWLSVAFRQIGREGEGGFDEENTGAFFFQASSFASAPDYSGPVRIGGDQKDLLGYNVEARSTGEVYVKLKLAERTISNRTKKQLPGFGKRKQSESAEAPAGAAEPGAASHEEEDDIPF